jgi:hypothetical protein
MVACLPSKHKFLSSNASTIQKMKTKKTYFNLFFFFFFLFMHSTGDSPEGLMLGKGSIP